MDINIHNDRTPTSGAGNAKAKDVSKTTLVTHLNLAAEMGRDQTDTPTVEQSTVQETNC